MYLSAANKFQRWDLTKMELEATVPNPLAGDVVVMAMGSAARGPLYVGTKDQDRLLGLNPLTFREIVRQVKSKGDGFGTRFFGSIADIRVSANGLVVSMRHPGVISDGLQSLVLDGNVLHEHYRYKDTLYIIPSPDGKTLFTAFGLYTTDLRRIEERPGKGDHVRCLPAVHGNVYLSLSEVFAERAVSLGIHKLGDEQPLVTLRGLPDLDKFVDQVSGWQPEFQRHVHLIPDAKLIVILAPTNDRLHLIRFDPADVAGGVRAPAPHLP